MSPIDSLIAAVLKSNGDGLVMHVGERPYVLSPTGTANLSERPLTVEAMKGVLSDLLSADDQHTLAEVGAVEREMIPQDAPGDRFLLVAARGGDDIWIELRRQRGVVAVPKAPDVQPPAQPPSQPAPQPALQEPSPRPRMAPSHPPRRHQPRPTRPAREPPSVIPLGRQPASGGQCHPWRRRQEWSCRSRGARSEPTPLAQAGRPHRGISVSAAFFAQPPHAARRRCTSRRMRGRPSG